MLNKNIKIFNQELWAVCEAAHNADSPSIKASIYALMVNLSASEKEIEIEEWYREKAYLFNQISQLFERVAKEQCLGRFTPKKENDKDDSFTIPEITHIYNNISPQAIRQACNEGRLPYDKGNGKCKYLIKKCDMDKYFKSAKGKKPK